ncbi:MAG: FG-GAP repeat domain-containing protein [Thermoanaerobaculia bacterium]
MSLKTSLSVLLVLALGCATAPAPQEETEAAAADSPRAAETPAGVAETAASPEPATDRTRINPITGEEVSLGEWLKLWDIERDPGPDPDPERIWERNGVKFQIMKFPKDRAAFDAGPGLVRPIANFNIAREIYQTDDEFVWAWMMVPGQESAMEQARKQETDESKYHPFSEEAVAYLRGFKDEFEPATPRRARRTLTFVEGSTGLPAEGSWRNAPAVADMNGDGHLDIIAPPQRGSIAGAPAIFLGDGEGSWRLWPEIELTGIRPLDYGTVAAGDLDGDGAMDLALASHLQGVTVFLGDGSGKFTEVTQGLEIRFPTRRLVVHDLDVDGDLDIVAISEGPLGSRNPNDAIPPPPANIVAFFNDGTGRAWTPRPVGEPWRQAAGDWLAVGRFNDDAFPDIVGASIFFSGPDLFYFGGETGWTAFGRGFIPLYSYYLALTAGDFTSDGRDDAVLSYGHFWPESLDPATLAPPEELRMVGLDLVTWRGAEPSRTTIARWPSRAGIGSLASGDLDLDGKRDLIFVHPEPREARILLGDGKGGFREAEVAGLPIPANNSYDITLADVDRDGRLDVIMLFERQEYDPGAIRVWLNRTDGR